MQQRYIGLPNSNIDQRFVVIHYINEAFARFEFVTHKVLDLGRGDHAVNGRTYDRVIETLLGARHFRRPVIRLRALDASLGSIVVGERPIHLGEGGLMFRFRRRKR